VEVGIVPAEPDVVHHHAEKVRPRQQEAVARLAVDRQLWVISDECYEALTFEGRHISIAQLGADIKARTIVVNTCSKAYAMTGWRIGYAAGPKAVIRAITRRGLIA